MDHFRKNHMKKVSVGELQKRLQSLLDAVGAKKFPKAKRMMLDGLKIVDAKGEDVDLSELDITLTPSGAIAEGDGEEDDVLSKEEEVEEVDEEEEEYLPVDDLGEEDAKEMDEDLLAADEEVLDEEEEIEDEKTTRKPRRPRKASKSVSIKSIVRKELGMKSTPMIKIADRNRFKFGSLKHFKGDGAEERAYRFGRWAMGCMGHKKSLGWCSNNGVQVKTHQESVNSAGGYLVPEEFSDALITLREEFGVFRANAKIEAMSSDTKRIPRRDATLTASFVGETSAGTETTQQFSQIQLIAKKLMVLTVISSELQEDALINLGDSIAGEIAYAFSNKEDECGFNGDGSATYGGISGLKQSILAGGIVDSGVANTSLVTIASIHSLLAKLPQYADTPNTKFFMHKSMYHALLERLFLDQGGSPGREFADGFGQPTIMGYPVVFSQVMANSTTTTGAETLMYFGDMSQTSYMGDRRSNTIAFSDSALNAFEQDEMVVRGTERFDIVNTNVGDASVAGSMVKLTL